MARRSVGQKFTGKPIGGSGTARAKGATPGAARPKPATPGAAKAFPRRRFGR